MLQILTFSSQFGKYVTNYIHYSAACRGAFISNNLKIVIFCVTLSVSCIIFANCSSQHSFSSLRLADICFLLRSATSFHSGLDLKSDWVIITPWIFSLFSHSVVELLLCLSSLSCCVTQHQPHIWLQSTLVYRGAGQLSDCKVPRSCGHKTSPNYRPSTTPSNPSKQP